MNPGDFTWSHALRHRVPLDVMEDLDRAARRETSTALAGESVYLAGRAPSVLARITSTGAAPIYDWAQVESTVDHSGYQSVPGLLTGTATDGSGAREINGLMGVPVDAIVLLVPDTSGGGEGWSFAYHGLTVQEADGAPSYPGITTLQVDQAAGLHVSQPAAGVARITQTEASPTTVGFVSIEKQKLAGTKVFLEPDDNVAGVLFNLELNYAGANPALEQGLGLVGGYTLGPATYDVFDLRCYGLTGAGGQPLCQLFDFSTNQADNTGLHGLDPYLDSHFAFYYNRGATLAGGLHGAAASHGGSYFFIDQGGVQINGGSTTTGGLTFVGGLYTSGSAVASLVVNTTTVSGGTTSGILYSDGSKLQSASHVKIKNNQLAINNGQPAASDLATGEAIFWSKTS